MQALKIFLLILVAVTFVSCVHGVRVPRKLSKMPEGTVKTLKGDEGQIIDCVDIYKQPAFSHPLMKNHTLQMEPPVILGAKENNEILDAMFDISWRKNGGCPDGSVPIVRHILTDKHVIRKNVSIGDPASYNVGHQYAVIFFNTYQASMQGGHGSITIWDPSLARSDDFSLSQMWITAGPPDTVQTIEAGWQKYPGRTGYNGPSLFVYWTNNGYKQGTGCYDLTCPGFVQYSQQYTPGMTLKVSTYGGNQVELPIVKQRDSNTGNWWLYLAGTPVGYWPQNIYYPGPLATGANSIQWGGEILDSSGSLGFHTLTQMGSGHFPNEGYRRSSYIRNLAVVDGNRNTYNPSQNQFTGTMPAPNCYRYEFQQGSSELYMFYGGPGCN